jgi:hypothetical protein
MKTREARAVRMIGKKAQAGIAGGDRLEIEGSMHANSKPP